MNKVLFHIPHSSLKIPKSFWSVCIKDKNYIKNSCLFMSDYKTNSLAPAKSHKVVFKYSRLFCDVEKFKDDKLEVMSSKGMGAIYIKDCDETICLINNKYKKKVLKSYYDKHHNKLDKITTKILNKYNKCIIVDLHSFSDEMVKKLFNKDDNPDICIGIDTFYTSKKLEEFTIDYFKKKGYSIKVNYPYEGTIVPNKHYHRKDKRIESIMLEINKRVYLNSDNDFNKLKESINDYYEKLNGEKYE